MPAANASGNRLARIARYRSPGRVTPQFGHDPWRDHDLRHGKICIYGPDAAYFRRQPWSENGLAVSWLEFLEADFQAPGCLVRTRCTRPRLCAGALYMVQMRNR